MTWDEIQELVVLNKKIRKMGSLGGYENERLGELRIMYSNFNWKHKTATVDIPRASAMRKKDYLAITQRNG